MQICNLLLTETLLPNQELGNVDQSYAQCRGIGRLPPAVAAATPAIARPSAIRMTVIVIAAMLARRLQPCAWLQLRRPRAHDCSRLQLWWPK
jgi:hypothetical protein